jgi:MFS family permease
MALLDPVTAKRIDRLARRAHRFHRFAHHPLCGAYADELIRLGRRGRLCRGCSYVALGLVVGALLALLVAPSWVSLASRTSSAALLGVALAGGPTLAVLRARVTKLATRALPAALLGFAFVLGARLATPLGLFFCGASMLALAATVLGYRRRGPDRTPCATCPERTLNVCSGLLPVVRRERAFRRASRRLLASAHAS